MAKSEYIECTYCGATNDKLSEKCKKCGKYHTEDAEEFNAYINRENNYLKKRNTLFNDDESRGNQWN